MCAELHNTTAIFGNPTEKQSRFRVRVVKGEMLNYGRRKGIFKSFCAKILSAMVFLPRLQLPTKIRHLECRDIHFSDRQHSYLTPRFQMPNKTWHLILGSILNSPPRAQSLSGKKNQKFTPRIISGTLFIERFYIRNTTLAPGFQVLNNM